MADVNPELAFLESQKEYDPAGDYSHIGAHQHADDEEEEEYDSQAEEVGSCPTVALDFAR